MLTVKSSDVLDVTHHTVRSFRAQVVGAFKRTGPNSWDDYRLLPETGPELDVYPGIPVQLEANGVEIRSRNDGRVVRLRWLPDADELAALSAEVDESDLPRALRKRFVEHYLSAHTAESVLGPSGVVAAKLSG
jgi:hypothetical protein